MMFFNVCPFLIKMYEFVFPWQPNRRNSSNFTAESVLLTFQMEQNGTNYGKFELSLLNSSQKVGLR